jgi:hypothetical protein
MPWLKPLEIEESDEKTRGKPNAMVETLGN